MTAPAETKPILQRMEWGWNRAAPKTLLALAAAVFVSVVAQTADMLLVFAVLLVMVTVSAGLSDESKKLFRQSHPAAWGLGWVLTAIYVIVVIRIVAMASPLVGLIILGIFGLFAAIRVPYLLVGAVVFLAASSGGQMSLFAAPVVVLLAARSLEVTNKKRLGLQAWLRSVGIAVVAFLLSFLVSNLGFGGGSSASQNPEESQAEPQGGARATDSSFFEWLNRILGRTQEVAGTAPGDGVGSFASPPEPETNWLLILAIVALVLVCLAVGVYLWRRFRQSAPGVGSLPGSRAAGAWSMDRLERIGESVGRPRQPSEGAISYAEALAKHTGDDRLREVGPLVSAQVFAGIEDESSVRATIGRLEADPPQAPPSPPEPTRRERIEEKLRSVGESARQQPRRIALLAGVIGFLGLAGWFVATRTTDLSLAYADPVTGLVELAQPPDEVDQLFTVLANQPDEVRRWEACASVENAVESAFELDAGVSLTTGVSGFNAGVLAGNSNQFWDVEDGLTDQWNLYGSSGVYATTRNEQVEELIWWKLPDAVKPAAPFTSVEDLVRSLPDDREELSRVDRDGVSYERFVFAESLLADDVFFSIPGWFRTSLFNPGPTTLDVWSEGDDIARLRFQSFEGGTQLVDWKEFRLSKNPDTLGGVFQATCPNSAFSESDDWMGADIADLPSPETLDSAPEAIGELEAIIAERPNDIHRWEICGSDGWGNSFGVDTSLWGRGGFSVEEFGGWVEQRDPDWPGIVVGLDSVWHLATGDQIFSPEAPSAEGPYTWNDVTNFQQFRHDSTPPTSIEQILEVFGEPQSMTVRIDRNGEQFQRFVFTDELVDFEAFYADAISEFVHAPWEGSEVTIDIWADGDSIRRLRSQDSAYEGEVGWLEFWFLDEQPSSLADLYAFEGCPSGATTPTDQWMGRSTTDT